jgi:hypothetical protein
LTITANSPRLGHAAHEKLNALKFQLRCRLKLLFGCGEYQIAASLSPPLTLSLTLRLFRVLGMLGVLWALCVLVVLLANVGIEVAVIGKGTRGKRTTEDAGETQEASNQFVHEAWTKFFTRKVSSDFVAASSTPPMPSASLGRVNSPTPWR